MNSSHNIKSTECVTPKFRMAFPVLLEPKENLQKELQYSITMLFPNTTDISVLEAAAKNAAEFKWGMDSSKWPTNLRMPFADGVTKGKIDGSGQFRVYKGYEDTVVINAKRSGDRPPPTIVGPNPHIVITDPKEVYGGRWAKAFVSFYAYDRAGNRGVGVGLTHVQLLDHDEHLGGVPNPEDIFDMAEGAVASDAAAAFSDEELPF